MSRLIDADKLIEDILNSMPTGSARGVFRAFIEGQPTAFDVDKVISNIWDRSELIHIKHNCYDEVEDYIRVTDVSEIVKAGEIDEYDRE